MKKERWIIKSEIVRLLDMRFKQFKSFERICKILIWLRITKYYYVEFRVEGELFDNGLITDYFD
jgi:hypothetical protein